MTDSASRIATILMYHSVCQRPGQGEFARFVVDPKGFAEHLEHLAATGRRTVRVEQLDQADPSDVSLTFDDGYADFYDVVLPLLEQFDACATLYLPTAYIDGTAQFLFPSADADRPLLSWSQVGELLASGRVEIGAHSHTHAQLDRLDRARLQAEVRLPKVLLEQQLQVPVASYAYPFGYFDARTRLEVERAGYQKAVQVADRPATLRDGDFAVPRLTVNAGTSVDELESLLRRQPDLPTLVRTEAKRFVWRGVRAVRREVAAPDGVRA